MEETLLNTITGKYKHFSKGEFITIYKCTLSAESSLLWAPLCAFLRATFLPPPFCKNKSKEIMGGKNGGCLELSNSLSFSSPVLSLSRQLLYYGPFLCPWLHKIPKCWLWSFRSPLREVLQRQLCKKGPFFLLFHWYERQQKREYWLKIKVGTLMSLADLFSLREMKELNIFPNPCEAFLAMAMPFKLVWVAYKSLKND